MAESKRLPSDQLSLFQRSYLLQAWLGICLALLFGIALAAVQAVLGPKIEANKINETMIKVPELVGVAVNQRQEAEKLTILPRMIAVAEAGHGKSYAVFQAEHPDGRLAGWVTKARGLGYADRIELLLGFDPQAEKLTGLFILDQKETPGLGNKIIDSTWRNQFIGKRTGQPLTVVKNRSASGQEINAVTGATISSRSVAAIVNAAMNDLRAPLAEAALDRTIAPTPGPPAGHGKE